VAAAQLRPDPRQQLVERERLGDVIAGAEPEAAELRLEVGARRDDHDRQLGPTALELPQDGQAVEPRQQEVEDDQVVVFEHRLAQAIRPVASGIDREPFRLQAA
jgi:hypothetical protein